MKRSPFDPDPTPVAPRELIALCRALLEGGAHGGIKAQLELVEELTAEAGSYAETLTLARAAELRRR